MKATAKPRTEAVDSNNLPALLTVFEICNNPKKGTRGVLNCSRSWFYEAVKRGILPKPIYIGERMPVWRREDIEEIMENGYRKAAA